MTSSSPTRTEDLLRELAPRVLGAVVRRYGDFAASEDAVQEALITVAAEWSIAGPPENPLGWLIRVASRRRLDQQRSDDARRRREQLAASLTLQPDLVADEDDTLLVMFLCCHPTLTPGSAIPLTLRAVGGLTTREIAAAYLVPEATMAQRISRAKQRIKATHATLALPDGAERGERLSSVLRVLYLLFNEGYATSAGPDLARTDLSGEAVRLSRMLAERLPNDAEVIGLLALMLLTDARRLARTRNGGELVPLEEQDRSRWDHALIAEGSRLIQSVFHSGPAGEYQLQAAIAAVHDDAARAADTDWAEILALYGVLEQLTGNPLVTLNRAVAAAMVHGPTAGLRLLDTVTEALSDHHRLHAVRGHLLEQAGRPTDAIVAFTAAAARTANLAEQRYLATKAAGLRAGIGASVESFTLAESIPADVPSTGLR